MDGVALGHPVGGEVRGEDEHAQVREAHVAQRGEGRADVGAARKGAAAAIDHQIRLARKSSRPFFQIGKALCGRRGAVERGSGDVCAFEEGAETGTDDNRGTGALRRRELADEIRRLDGLCGRPGIGRGGRRQDCQQHGERDEQAGNEQGFQGCAFFLDSHTTPNIVSKDIATKIGIPVLVRDVFLDDIDEKKEIMKQIEILEQKSRQKGYAIAIGHDRYNTLTLLAEVIPELEKDGFEMVSLGDLIEHRVGTY